MSDTNTNTKKYKCKDTNTSEGPANYPSEKERGWINSNTEIDTQIQTNTWECQGKIKAENENILTLLIRGELKLILYQVFHYSIKWV